MKPTPLRGLALLFAHALFACSSDEQSYSSASTDAAPSPFRAEETAEAAATLASLRERFGEAVLPPVSDEVRGEGATADVEPLHDAQETPGFVLRDRASSARLRVRLDRTRPTAAERGSDYLVRRDALDSGVHFVQRPLADGVEDYFYFPEAPEAPELEYTVRLEDGLVALRQIDNALEFLDAEGTPRLRVSPPYLVDAHQRQVAVALHVDDCAVDTDPAPPWGRQVTPPGAETCRVRFSWPDETSYPALVDPAWVTTANTAVTRQGHTLTKLQNGRVLLVGGASSAIVNYPVPPGWEEHSATQLGIPETEIFDPATETWSFTGTAQGRHSHIAELLPSGEVLVAGGLDGTEYPNENSSFVRFVGTAQRYNPANGTWTNAAALLSPHRARAASTLLDDGTVLVTGGYHGQSSAASGETYNPTTNTWTATGALKRPRARHASIKLSNGRVLLLGGDDASGAASEIYNPTNRSFGTVRTSPVAFGSVPTAAESGASLPGLLTLTRLPNNEILAVGQRAIIYNSSSHAWREVGSPLHGRGGHTAALLADGNVLVFGATNPVPNHLATEIFRPGYYGGLWTPGPSESPSRAGTRSVTLNDGRLLVQSGTRTDLYTHPTDPQIHVADYLVPASGSSHAPLVEYRGRVYRPATLANKRYPLILILHARLPACIKASPLTLVEWSPVARTCPAGFTVQQHHLGYGYIAEELARQGFIVVSVNWDISSGPVDPDSDNLSPIRDVALRHLVAIRNWDTGSVATPATLGASLANRIDFSNVGLIGHSNGGGAAVLTTRSGINNLSITYRGVLGLAPVEGENPNDIAQPSIAGRNWVGVIPSCDRGGGRSQDKPFERLARDGGTWANFAATHLVPGGNHNFYNTEVEYEDTFTPYVPGGSCGSQPRLPPIVQRQTGLRAALALFRGKLGSTASSQWLQLFEPRNWSNSPIYPAVQGGFWEPSLSLENFTRATGTSQRNYPTQKTGGLTLTHDSPAPPAQYAFSYPQAKARWTSSGTWSAYFSAAGQGINLSSYTWLDISVVKTKSSLNSGNTNLSVALIRPDGTFSSSAAIGSRIGPPIDDFANDPRPPKATIRVPLSNFYTSLNSIRGIRLSTSGTGELWVAHIRASKPH